MEVLRERAVDQLGLPGPKVGMSPPSGDVLVRFPTWLWVEGPGSEPRSASASAGPVTVTATATPSRVEWNMGNGDRVVCQGPGTRYDPRVHKAESASPDCGYVYTDSSYGEPRGVFKVTARAVWQVSWTAVGAAGGGPLGEMSSSTIVPVTVYEIQALESS